jgi:hypothetical protein
VDKVDPVVVSGFLKDLRVRLVVLNACYTSDFASALVNNPESKVQVCIGWDGKPTDQTARAYAATLYDELCKGRSVAVAHQAATSMISKPVGISSASGQAPGPHAVSPAGAAPRPVLQEREKGAAAKLLLVQPSWTPWLIGVFVIVLVSLAFILGTLIPRPRVPHSGDLLPVDVKTGPEVASQKGGDGTREQMDKWLDWCRVVTRNSNTQAYLVARAKETFTHYHQTFTVRYKFEPKGVDLSEFKVDNVVAFLVKEHKSEGKYEPTYRQMKVVIGPVKPEEKNGDEIKAYEGTVTLESPDPEESLLLLFEVRTRKGGLSVLKGEDYGLKLTKK